VFDLKDVAVNRMDVHPVAKSGEGPITKPKRQPIIPIHFAPTHSGLWVKGLGDKSGATGQGINAGFGLNP